VRNEYIIHIKNYKQDVLFFTVIWL